MIKETTLRNRHPTKDSQMSQRLLLMLTKLHQLMDLARKTRKSTRRSRVETAATRRRPVVMWRKPNPPFKRPTLMKNKKGTMTEKTLRKLVARPT